MSIIRQGGIYPAPDNHEAMTDEARTKTPEELTTELTGIKMRLRRMEDYLLDLKLPDASDYISPPRLTTEGDEEDELFGKAVHIVRQYKRASASLLQNRLDVGYARASRLIRLLEAKGILEPAEGSMLRNVLPENDEPQDGYQTGESIKLADNDDGEMSNE